MALVNRRIEQLAQKHRFRLAVGELDADHVSARNDRDAYRNGAHRASNIVGETDDPRRFDAGGGLELVQRDDGPRANLHDLTADAKILEHRLEQPGVFFQGLFVDRLSLGHRRFYQELEGGQDRLLLGFEVERRLALSFGTFSWCVRPRRWSDETN